MILSQTSHRLLILLSLIMCIYHGGRLMMSVIAPHIQPVFGLSYRQVGLLTGAYDWGYGFALLPAGYLADRYGKKRLISWGLLWFGVMTFLAGRATSSDQIIMMRFLSGFGLATFYGAATSLVGEQAGANMRGQAIGFQFSGGALGRFIFPPLVALIIPMWSWREAFFLIGLIGLLCFGVFVLGGVNPEAGNRKSNNLPLITFKRWLKNILVNHSLLKVGLLYAIVASANLTVYVFVPLYLVNVRSMPLDHAALLLALIQGVSVVSSPLLGWISDRFGRKKSVAIFMAVYTIALVCFSFCRPGFLLIAVVVIFGIVTRVTTPIITWATESSDPAIRSSSMSLFALFGALSGATSQYVLGGLADWTGLASVFFFLAFLMVNGIVFTLMTPSPR